jgi:Tfp pilus assembly protein PilF
VDDGIAHVRAALAIEPDYALGHMNLARLLASRGEMDEAERERSLAIDLDPALADVPLVPEP